MSVEPMIMTRDIQRDPLQVLGTSVTLLATGAESRGLAVTRQCGEAGMGPPSHQHAWDEMFYVISGSVDFVVDGEITPCGAGSMVFVPGGTIHGFSYGSDGGEMLEVTCEGSSAPQMFTDLDAEVPPGPPDIPTVVEVLGRYGVTVHA